MCQECAAFWLWFAGNRRSDTLIEGCQKGLHVLWFAGNRRSDTLVESCAGPSPVLWFAGNRRSDTLVHRFRRFGG